MPATVAIVARVVGDAGWRPSRLGALGNALGHQHRFRCGRRSVIHRGVRHLHAGQQRDLGLELEQILQRALSNFRLVGRVGRQELGAADEAIDRCRHVMSVRPAADEKWHRPGGQICRARPLRWRSTSSSARPQGRADSAHSRSLPGARQRGHRCSAPRSGASMSVRSCSVSGRYRMACSFTTWGCSSADGLEDISGNPHRS